MAVLAGAFAVCVTCLHPQVPTGVNHITASRLLLAVLWGISKCSGPGAKSRPPMVVIILVKHGWNDAHIGNLPFPGCHDNLGPRRGAIRISQGRHDGGPELRLAPLQRNHARFVHVINRHPHVPLYGLSGPRPLCNRLPLAVFDSPHHDVVRVHVCIGTGGRQKVVGSPCNHFRCTVLGVFVVGGLRELQHTVIYGKQRGVRALQVPQNAGYPLGRLQRRWRRRGPGRR